MKHGRQSRLRGVLRFLLTFAAGFAACLVLLLVAANVLHLGRFINEKDYDYLKKVNDGYGKYYVIMEMIGEDPLSKKTPEGITDESLRRIVAETGDPYAQYYTAKEFEEFRKRFIGDYVGIGILVGQTDDGFRVEQVYDGGPAAGAGMKAGDMILKVDGVVPSDLDDAVSRMTGEKGTEVTVTVRRDDKELDLTMTRESIDLESVGYAVSEDDAEVGYIRIASFADDTDDEFKDAVKELQAKGCDKFIVDLRDNGGGLTDSAINIADYLLPECRIMTEVRKDGSETAYDSKKSSADLDLVLLVNGNTASASEILTAALSENGACKVIGTKTYGKGVTQVTHQFQDGSAVKLTVTEYLTPKGNHVHNKGIEPDIEASDDDILDKALDELK